MESQPLYKELISSLTNKDTKKKLNRIDFDPDKYFDNLTGK